jgi:hypothetical protein
VKAWIEGQPDTAKDYPDDERASDAAESCALENYQKRKYDVLSVIVDDGGKHRLFHVEVGLRAEAFDMGDAK